MGPPSPAALPVRVLVVDASVVLVVVTEELVLTKTGTGIALQ